MSFSRGLVFKKFDLHVHTPASREDYRGQNTTAEDIVNAAIAKDLSAIAITDHQTGEWIDSIKTAAEGKNLTVFPGVELKVNGGQNGIHLIVLFDVDKTTQHVTQFLNRLEVYERNGETPSIADKTVTQVAKALKEFDDNALLILAHCLSNRGVISDMNGAQRESVFKPNLQCLLGAEAPESNFLDSQKKQSHDRVIDLLDGGFDRFYKKRMGVYQSSDAHKPSDVGSKYTYFKVDDPITIEDVRQCLIDRDTRIRQTFEYKPEDYPFIENLTITSGFLAGQNFEFHEGLNSILGAKGSGKSLAIELLRFALHQEPTIEELAEDHKAKLKNRLLLHGEVIVIYRDETGRRYQVKRSYNPADGNPTEIIDLTDNTKKEFEPSQIFPILFLSQNEIIKIAEDKASQREFIDKFFDFRKYQEEIEKCKVALQDVDQRFAEVMKARIKELKLVKKFATTKEEIEKINRQIKNEVFEEYSKKEKIGQDLKTHADFLGSLSFSLVMTKAEYSDLKQPEISTDANPAIKRANDSVKNAIQNINSGIDTTIANLEEARTLVHKELESWELSFQPIKEKYDKVVKDAGGNQAILDQNRKTLITQLTEVQTELTKCQGRSQQVKAVTDQRNTAVKNLEDAYKTYYEERKKRCEHFTTNSLGSLNVTIKEREDKTKFKENLMQFKKGSWLKEEEIEMIAEHIDPKSFIDNLLRYEWTEREQTTPLKEIAGATSIDLSRVETLATHLLTEYTYQDLLSILYTSIPNDIPSIKYKTRQQFQNLDELSVGQKSVALLIIALSDGGFPIIIDQPEDSLDLRSIWDDLCKKLRESKEKRQFIFTTHNSSVAVASDTDKFTILKAGASSGEVLFSGSLNRKDIKKEVIDYLEGGNETYQRKRHKYNI